MKRISLLAVMTLSGLLACGAFAQDAQPKPQTRPPGGGAGGPGGPGGGAGMREQMQKMEQELKLTDEQKTKMQEARKEQAEKAKALRDDTTLTQDQRMEKMKALRTDNQAKMKTLLTPEQFEKWTKMQGEMMNRRGQGGRGGQGAPGTPPPAPDKQPATK